MKLKYMMLALMPLCIASCSEEDIASGGVQQEVRVTAGVGAHSRMVLNDKGEYTESLWQNGDEISLFTSTQSNLVYSTSLEGNSASASFTATGESLQYIETNTVYACYPSVTEVEEGSLVVNLPATGSLDYNEGTVRSFCYATDKISRGSLNFKFKHLSAFLCLTVTPDMLSDATAGIAQVTVGTSSAVPLSVGEGDTFDFSTQTASTTNGSNTVRMNVDNLVVDSVWTVYIPVLPQPAGAEITVTLGSAEGEQLYIHTKKVPATGFLAGNVYKMDTSVSFEVAYLVDGPTFNQNLKELVSGGSPDNCSVGKIQFVTESNHVPEYHVVVSAEGSALPVYASFSQADSLLTISTAAKRMEIENASYMFYNFLSLRTIDFGNFTINGTTTDISYLFAACNSLEAVDVSGWNTSLVTNMSCTFAGCSSLTSLDVSGWNTDNVTDMSQMFEGCESLSSLDLSNFDTSNVANMSWMFYGCSSLVSLDLSCFETYGVNDMSYMFSNCSSLSSLDVSTWQTFQVVDMEYMFSNCSSLTMLNLLNWDINPQNSEISDMFDGCASASKACKIITNYLKSYLLMYKETTQMNPDWFIWGDAENGGSDFDEMSKEEW